jgi:hypothetical protein
MAYPFRFHPAAALAAATLTLAAPAGARTIGDWEVASGAKSCTMLSTFEDDVSIGLVSPRKGALSFVAGGKGMAGLVQAGQKVSLDLKFTGKVPHDDWADDAAAVVAAPDGGLMVIADWGPSFANELADTLTASSAVTMTIGGKTVGTYDLSGGAPAYRQLTRCGSELAAK